MLAPSPSHSCLRHKTTAKHAKTAATVHQKYAMPAGPNCSWANPNASASLPANGGWLGLVHCTTPSAAEQTAIPAVAGHLKSARGDHPRTMTLRESGATGRRRSQAMKTHSANKKPRTRSTGMGKLFLLSSNT